MSTIKREPTFLAALKASLWVEEDGRFYLLADGRRYDCAEGNSTENINRILKDAWACRKERNDKERECEGLWLQIKGLENACREWRTVLTNRDETIRGLKAEIADQNGGLCALRQRIDRMSSGAEGLELLKLRQENAALRECLDKVREALPL